MTIDLNTLPSGERYADEYGAWLEVWRQIAEEPGVVVKSPPHSWIPLARYLGATVRGSFAHFLQDSYYRNANEMYDHAKAYGRQREYVESVCTARPELVDALWKSDVQWQTVDRDHTWQREFVLTNYNGYYRPEILEYMKKLEEYVPPARVRNCVVTSCSADKPYPADVHRAVLDILPDESWHLVIATGVLGVVPQELWGVMPLYDAGIPNNWRCFQKWCRYAQRIKYDRIVVYADFYAPAVHAALSSVLADTAVSYPLPVGGRADYLDLADERWLNHLRRALECSPADAGSFKSGILL